MENEIDTMNYAKLSNILDNHMIPKYWLIIIIGAIGGFLVGYDAGIIGSAIIYVPFKLSTIQYAVAISGTGGVAAIGAFTAGPLIERYGRKALLIADGIIFAIFALLGAFSTDTLMFLISRIGIGYAVGADFAVAPVYISELAPMSRRGRLDMIQQIMIFVSGVIAFGVGFALSGLPSSINWRWMIGIGAFPAVVLAGLRFYLPESPRWLAVHNKVDHLRKSLDFLGIEMKGKFEVGNVPEFKYRFNRRAIMIVGLWVFFEIASGINVFLYYGPTIFVHLGFTGSRAILSTLILDAIASIGFVLAYFIIDKTIKKLALIGFIGMFIGMLLLATGSSFVHLFSGIALMFVGILFFFFFFQMAMGNSEMVLIGTALPTATRGIGGGIFAGIAWATSFAITFIFPLWEAAYGFTSFAILEAILCIGGIIWTILMLPELANKPIDSISQMYKTE
ncbi:MAG: MFS transporter [Candidatus Parvarchaeota archaeon]